MAALFIHFKFLLLLFNGQQSAWLSSQFLWENKPKEVNNNCATSFFAINSNLNEIYVGLMLCQSFKKIIHVVLFFSQFSLMKDARISKKSDDIIDKVL